MKRLSVNIDHVATLRQARGENEPDPVTAALIAELAGAVGIVSHLREDRRHIQDGDVYLLRKVLKTKLDLEMAATDEIVEIALDVVPDLVTLVPEFIEEQLLVELEFANDTAIYEDHGHLVAEPFEYIRVLFKCHPFEEELFFLPQPLENTFGFIAKTASFFLVKENLRHRLADSVFLGRKINPITPIAISTTETS